MSVVEHQVITAAEVRHAESERKSLIVVMAEKYGIESNRLMATLKATCFKGDVTNEQMAALLVVAHQHNLNPFTKEIHAFDDRRGGIVPVVGVDGWARIVNEHPAFDGMHFEQDDEKCTCTMYRKDRKHPTKVTEYMSECKRPTGPWGSHPKRMLRHKALIQAARYAFSFAGIFDPDEAEAIVSSEIDVTPHEEGEMTRGELGPPRKVSAVKLRKICDGLLDAVKANDGQALLAIRRTLDNEEWLYINGKFRSYEKAAVRKLLEETEKADQGMQLDNWSKSLARECDTDQKLSDAFKTVTEAYEASGAEVPDSVLTFFDECRQTMGAA